MNNYTRDDNIDKIKQIISRVARIDISEVDTSSSLRNDLMIDSLQASQIIAAIEEDYALKIDEIELFNVDTVLEVIELLEEYLKMSQSK